MTPDKPLEILLVEGDPGAARLLREMVADGWGGPFEMSCADRVGKGLELLARQPFDIVLLSLDLPDSAGLAAVERVLRAAPDVPLLVVSAKDDMPLGAAAVRAGAHEHLVRHLLTPHWLQRALLHALERHAAARTLRGSEERYRLLFNSGPDAILVLQWEGSLLSRLLEVNDVACQRLGYRREELLQLSLADIAGNQLTEQARLRELMESEKSAIFELSLVARDGTVLPAEVGAHLFEFDRRPAVLAVVRDISERQRTEEKLRRALEQATRSNQELEQYAYVASHDLQEPLRMVQSYVQLLQERYQGKLDKEADEFIGYAVQGADRMKALIEDLLSLSRVGTRGKPLEGVESGAALDEALANLQPATEKSGAQITRDPLPRVTADAGQLEQVFQNLVGNAIKFHGERPEVHVSARREGPCWVFSVRDNGLGIDQRYFERIFVIFQRLHGRDEYPGTGIGLATCKKIVERHGGRIWVESEPGKGSTFSFTLPAGDG